MKLKVAKLNRIVFPIAALLLLAAAAAVFAAVRAPRSQVDEPQTPCVALEGAFGTVQLSPVATSSEEYDRLKEACDANRETAEKMGSAVSNQTVIVSEDTFVDAGSAETPEETMIYVESETVYFAGMVLIHYASHSGDHVTYVAHYDADGIPVVLNIDGLVLEGFFRVQEPEERAPADGGAVNASQFLSAIHECVGPLITGGTMPAHGDQLFTDNGKIALTRVGQFVEADEDTGIEVVLSAVGSTSPDEMLADRILLRCRVTVEDRIMALDLLLKLNDELMIYDVDLIS